MSGSSGPAPDERLPIAYVLTGWAENAVSILGLMLAGALANQRPSTPGWLTVGIWALLVLRFLSPIYAWLTTRFRVSEDGLWLSRGLLMRRTRYVAWDAVTTVQVDQPFSFRAAGLARISLLQGGEDATRLVMPGIRHSQADAIAAKVGDSRARRDPTPSTTANARQIIYAATYGDLLIASIIYGKFAVLGFAVALAALDWLQTWGAQDWAFTMATRSPLLAATVVAFLVFAVGAAATVIRYAGLQTHRRDDALTIAFGLFSRSQRVISPDGVEGVEVRQNFLELWSGRARLSVISVDSSDRLGTNLVLPSLRSALVEELADSVLSTAPKGGWRIERRRVAQPVLALALTTGIALAPVAILRPSLLIGAASFVVIFALVRWAGSAFSSGLRSEPESDLLAATSRWISRRDVLLHPKDVHVVSLMQVKPLRPLARVYYYAGRSRVLVARKFSNNDLQWLAHQSLQPSTRGIHRDRCL